MKAKEIRDMSREQRVSLLKETSIKLFHLRVQARMERLDSPSEVAKARKLIAQIKTIQRAFGQDEEFNPAVGEE